MDSKRIAIFSFLWPDICVVRGHLKESEQSSVKLRWQLGVAEALTRCPGVPSLPFWAVRPWADQLSKLLNEIAFQRRFYCKYCNYLRKACPLIYQIRIMSNPPVNYDRTVSISTFYLRAFFSKPSFYILFFFVICSSFFLIEI